MGFADLLWTSGKDNMGGLVGEIYFCPIEDIESLPALSAVGSLQTAVTDIVCKAGKKFHRIYHTAETGKVDTTTVGDFDGKSKLNLLSFFYPGDDETLAEQVRLLQNSPGVYICKDSKGNLRLLGVTNFEEDSTELTLERPAYVQITTGTTGAAGADRRGTTFEVVHKAPHRPVFYRGEVPVEEAEETLLQLVSVENDSDSVLDLVFSSAVTISTTGWTITTDGASPLSISSVLSGNGTTTPKLQLSRSILFDETLYISYDGNGDTAIEAIDRPITNNVGITFNGVSQYGTFGDILDSVIAANDTNFWISLTIDKMDASSSRRLITKAQPSNGPGFVFFLNTSRIPIFGFNTNSTNRRTIIGDTAVQDGDILTLKYNGAVDTNDGLDRVTFEINGVATGKSMSFTTGTLPTSIPNIAEHLGFGDLVNSSGVNNGAAMFKGDVSNLVIRSNNGATVEVNIPDLETGLDTSGNNRHMTRSTNVRALTPYTTRSNRNLSALIGYTSPNDWQGRPRLVEREGVWIMAFVEGDEHSTDGSQSINIAFSENKGMPWLAKNTFTDGSAVSGIPFTVEEGSCIAENNLILCPNNDLVLIVHKRLADATFLGHWQSRSTDGGKTWSELTDISSSFEVDAALQWACYDYTVDDNDNVYIALSAKEQADPNISAKCMLYKSDDNCETWTKVSDITAYADKTWEAGIQWLSGTTMLCVMRSSGLNEGGAEVRISTDLGETWSALTDITISSKGLHQPRLKKFANDNRVYVFGRIYDSSLAQRNGFLYSDNNGTSWTLVEDTGITSTDDGGYGDGMKREDNIITMVAYSGELGVDGYLREYVIIGS